MPPLHTTSTTYLLLQQIIWLWISLIALLILTKHRLPNPRVHNVINLSLAGAAVVEFLAIIVVVVTLGF